MKKCLTVIIFAALFSQGTYSNHIKLILYNRSYQATSFEIYRSLQSNGPYRLIARTPVTSVYEDVSYFDTISGAATQYYYKIAVTDKAGRGSAMSSYSYGYLKTIGALENINITIQTDDIGLSWPVVSSANYYNVYRSSISCSDKGEKIASTTATLIKDSVPTYNSYYYHVTAVDTIGHESLQSTCVSGKLAHYLLQQE